jgi:hypothetical protein
VYDLLGVEHDPLSTAWILKGPKGQHRVLREKGRESERERAQRKRDGMRAVVWM